MEKLAGEELGLHSAPEGGRWGNRLLAALPPDVAGLLEQDMRQVSLPQGAVCFGVGDLIDLIYFPTSGMISSMIMTGDGGMVETSSIGREGAAGLQSAFGERRSFARALVQIPGRFTIVPAARFAQVANASAPVRDIVLCYTETLWAEAQQLAACNAIHGGSSRLCRWLLQTADRIGADQLLLTQEFLAEMLGVRRTTVTLLAQELQRHGIVKYSRGKITIIDRPTLEELACECYHVTKHDNLPRRIGVDFQAAARFGAAGLD